MVPKPSKLSSSGTQVKLNLYKAMGNENKYYWRWLHSRYDLSSLGWRGASMSLHLYFSEEGKIQYAHTHALYSLVTTLPHDAFAANYNLFLHRLLSLFESIFSLLAFFSFLLLWFFSFLIQICWSLLYFILLGSNYYFNILVWNWISTLLVKVFFYYFALSHSGCQWSQPKHW